MPTVLLARRFMMHAQLLAQSRVDTKTGLLNASTWEQEAATEIARAIRTKSPLALALVDIDHFKSVNDTYGHLAGDKAPRAVTDTLRNQLRAHDRPGGWRGGARDPAPQAREVDALNAKTPWRPCRGHVRPLRTTTSPGRSSSSDLVGVAP